MPRNIALVFFFFLFIGFTSSIQAQEQPATLHFETFQMKNATYPSLGVLTMTIKHPWHVYGPFPTKNGLPTRVQAQNTQGSFIVRYPLPQQLQDPNAATALVIYKDEVHFFIPLPSREKFPLLVTVQALLCSDSSCLPLRKKEEFSTEAVQPLPQAELQPWWQDYQKSILPEQEITSEILSSEPSETLQELDAPPAQQSPEFSPRYFSPGLEVKTLSKAALFAFLAGMILNFMPCVLPVITLKLRSFIPAVDAVSKSQRKAFRAHNLFFALGMVSYFLILAGIIAVTGMAWGQMFQKPAAIITLTAIVFALSLSLFGVYDLPLIDLKGKASSGNSHPRLESFTTGVLATILATPCSGPFLGGVLAWALIQPPAIIALVLSCIGFGMAFPYLIMSLFPGLYRFLPRPGAWTLTLERILGFLLTGTCLYLISLLPQEVYLDTLILLLSIAAAAWIWGNWASLSHAPARRRMIRILAVALIATTAGLVFRPQNTSHAWQPYTAQKFHALLGKENLVVEFTADWCPNCKFLEKTVLTPQKSTAIADNYNAHLLRVDLTRHDPELMALLESIGSKSIPVLAIFSPKNAHAPLVLRDLFTSGQLHEALESEL